MKENSPMTETVPGHADEQGEAKPPAKACGLANTSYSDCPNMLEVGCVCELLRSGKTTDFGGMSIEDARNRLQLANLSAIGKGKLQGAPHLGPLLAVPADGPILQRIFGDTEFHRSVWYTALKQAPRDIVLRDLGNAQKVKINGSTKHCLLVDLEAFEKFTARGD